MRGAASALAKIILRRDVRRAGCDLCLGLPVLRSLGIDSSGYAHLGLGRHCPRIRPRDSRSAFARWLSEQLLDTSLGHGRVRHRFIGPDGRLAESEGMMIVVAREGENIHQFIRGFPETDREPEDMRAGMLVCQRNAP